MTDNKTTTRKTLQVGQVEPVKKVGNKQLPKLSFRASDGDQEFTYISFRTSLFEAIKEGQTIDADIETSSREYEGNTYTDRRIVEIYKGGQPIGGKGGQGYRGKSPEELELSAKSYALAYAKDLAVAQLLSLKDITKQAEVFYTWLKGKAETPQPPAVVEPPPLVEEAKKLGATEVPEFKNVGEFLLAAYNKLDLPGSKVLKLLDCKIPSDITDFTGAWVVLTQSVKEP